MQADRAQELLRQVLDQPGAAPLEVWRELVALQVRLVQHELDEAAAGLPHGAADRVRGAAAQLRRLEHQLKAGVLPRVLLQDRAEDMADRASHLSGLLAEFSRELRSA